MIHVAPQTQTVIALARRLSGTPYYNPYDAIDLPFLDAICRTMGTGSGEIGPAGPAGADGAPGAPGADGAAGTDGTDGVDGKTLLNGTIDPTTEGVDGDFYINTTSHQIFGPKASGVWPAGVNIVGPAGANGSDGADGADGAAGAAGSKWYSGTGAPAGGLYLVGDWYLDDANGDVYEKTGASAWTLRDNITGPTGADGAPGADGADGLDGGTLTTAQMIDLIYPVGSIYTSIVSTNPGTLFGTGTWAAFATGRVLVGLDSGDTAFDTVEETGGAKTHTLLATEMPAHVHAENAPASASGGTMKFALDTNASGTQAAGLDTGSAGGGGAHNNLQPYIVVYMWKRTA